MNTLPPDTPRPTDDDLQQSLLELHYGLLDDEEAEPLRRQIESDPVVAKLWADTLLMAGKFAEAAKVQAPAKAEVSPPVDATSDEVAREVDTSEPTPPPKVEVAQPSDEATLPPSGGKSKFLLYWAGSFAAAAAVVIAIAGVGRLGELPRRPIDSLRVAVESVSGAEATARNEFWIVTQEPPRGSMPSHSIDTSMPIMPASISFRVLAGSVVLFVGESKTNDDDGRCRIKVPDELALPADAVLEVDAKPSDGGEYVRLTVPLEPTRCLTYVSTDRPVYRPGESVFFRSVTLNRRTLRAHLDVPIRFELLDPSGAAVPGAALEGISERGVGNGSFLIPESAAGGTYKLVAKSLDGFFPEQTSEIEVRRYRAVRLKTNLEFDQRSYGAGDRVGAELSVRRADDEIPAGAPVRVSAVVDEVMIHQESATLDDQGQLSVSFDLPNTFEKGDGFLSIAIDDGNTTESATRPIPIHTGKAQVEFYPEGGYLVGGVDNRVYFAARDVHDKPIAIEGEILSQSGRVVAEVKTVRDGLGKFQFKPESGQRYSLRITSPLDITETPWLPSVIEALPVMDTGRGVFDVGEPIKLTLRNTKRREIIVRAVCRGELVGVQSLSLGIGETAIEVPVQDRASGVVRVTVLDAEGEIATPLVERLVFRKGFRELNVDTIVDDQRRVHSPGESVRMTIKVTDENGDLVPGAVLGVSVVDDTALSLRQQEIPTIKTHFLLTSEVDSPEDLEHANFYLADGEEAAESLDLLLGTQGWRRFVSGDPNQFNESFRESLVRLLELDGVRAALDPMAKSNAAILAQQHRDYRIAVGVVWGRFVEQIQWSLLLIALIWMFALLLKPRRGYAVGASLLLMAALLAIHVGCGAAPTSQIASTSEDMEEHAALAEADEMMMAQGMEMEMEKAVAEEPSLPPVAPEDAMENAGAAGPPKPFVRRIVDAIIQRASTQPGQENVANAIPADKLARWADARGLDSQTLADQLMDELRFPIRQYAHAHRRPDPEVRSDFAETVYWNPMMVTDSTGTATIRFDLSDSLTLFRVQVDAHAGGGRLGSGGGEVITRLPVQVEPKMPLEVTGGDRIDLPVGLVNASGGDAEFEVAIRADDVLDVGKSQTRLMVRADGRVKESFSLSVAENASSSQARVTVSASEVGGSLGDQVERTVKIVPGGFPFTTSSAGNLRGDTAVKLKLPDAIVPGSLSGSLRILPSSQSQLSAGMESILREPHGCFEQTSSSNYPNIMAFQLMSLEGNVDASMRRRTESLLRRGYRKLTSYECSRLGYEWFGNDPGHEALSAFGLMQFTEMSKAIAVDQAMLERTRKWLLSRRDGRGGFQRNPRHLHVWSVSQDTVNAYLLWAISEADRAAGRSDATLEELASEFDQLQRTAEQTDDEYLIALSAVALRNVNRDSVTRQLLERLSEMQSADGSLTGTTTITQSGGISLTVETTSLAILAWSRDNDFRKQARLAVDWLMRNRRSGGFGSTQATVLALKALITMQDRMGTAEGGEVEVLANGEPLTKLTWKGRPAEGLSWKLPESLLQQMQNTTIELTLRSSDEGSYPYAVELSGHQTTPESDAACPIDIDVAFAGKQRESSVTDGDTVDVLVEVTNRTETGRPMTLAVVGLPGGLEPVIEALDRGKDQGKYDYYEIRGREIALYWRTFAPQQQQAFTIPCVAAVPGRYTGPPSRGYLYYTAESKRWTEPLVVEITQ